MVIPKCSWCTLSGSTKLCDQSTRETPGFFHGCPTRRVAAQPHSDQCWLRTQDLEQEWPCHTVVMKTLLNEARVTNLGAEVWFGAQSSAAHPIQDGIVLLGCCPSSFEFQIQPETFRVLTLETSLSDHVPSVNAQRFWDHGGCAPIHVVSSAERWFQNAPLPESAGKREALVET